MATKNVNIVDTPELATKSNSGKPYDDVFRTLLVDCPELVIPLINEAFGEHYGWSEKVAVYHNEFFIVGNSDEV